MNGKLLCIDHGLKRLGLAVSDASGLVARELAIIKRKSKADDFNRINQITLEQNIVGIVVGLPTNETAPGAHSQADSVRHWVEHFARALRSPSFCGMNSFLPPMRVTLLGRSATR
jgi:putative transcription antitermination factor YqgF